MSQNNRKFTKEKSQLLRTLLAQAQRKGYIQAKTIKSRFARYNPSDEEMEDYFQQFKDSGIDIVHTIPSDNCYEEEDIKEEELLFDYNVPKSDTATSSLVNPMQLYLNEIHKYPTLTYKQTIALVHKVRAGDTAAREYLINCNLKFAFKIALKYVNSGVPLFDLVQEANIGLTNAVDRFNPHVGTRFTTYAIFWIKMNLVEFICNSTRLIHLPTSLCLDIANLRRHEASFITEYEREPTDDELASCTGLSISRIKYLKKHDLNYISTEVQADEEQESVFGDTLTDYDTTEDPHKGFYLNECRSTIANLLQKLTPRQRDVIILRFGLDPDISPLPLSLEETGKILGISKERVRQLENLALNKLRRMPDITALRPYLEL